MEKVEMGGETCRTQWGDKLCVKKFSRKHERKKPLGRPRHRGQNIVEVNLKQIGCNIMDQNEVAQHRDQWRDLLNIIMNFLVSKRAGNSLTSWATISVSKKYSGYMELVKILPLAYKNSTRAERKQCLVLIFRAVSFITNPVK